MRISDWSSDVCSSVLVSPAWSTAPACCSESEPAPTQPGRAARKSASWKAVSSFRCLPGASLLHLSRGNPRDRSAIRKGLTVNCLRQHRAERHSVGSTFPTHGDANRKQRRHRQYGHTHLRERRCKDKE